MAGVGAEHVQIYLGQLSSAWNRQNSEALATLLQLDPTYAGAEDLVDSLGCVDIETACRTAGLADELVGIAANHLMARAAHRQARLSDSFSCLQSSYMAFIDVFRAADTGWLVPSMNRITLDVRELALAADRQQTLKVGHRVDAHLRDAVMVLMKGFAASYKQQGEMNPLRSKKASCIYTCNTLFKIYFYLNTLRNCDNLIKQINNHRAFRMRVEDFPKALSVTYKLYVGRLAMFEDRDQDAADHLDFALRWCPAKYARNRRLILQYLVPVKLLLGLQPTPALLEKYGLRELAVIALAVRRGDIRSFNTCMQENQLHFVHQGVYLVLEKLRMLVYRNLFKRVCMLSENYPKMRIAQFQQALAWLDAPLDLDEIECILANLIAQGYIKGYIAHNQRMLVVKRGKISEGFIKVPKVKR